MNKPPIVEDLQKPKSPQQRQGTLMIFIGWGALLLTFVMFFQGVLEKRQNPNSLSVLSNQQSGEVVLQKNVAGHYYAAGLLNGEPVNFLLDTGATQIAVPTDIADALNLPRHARSVAQTAGGSVPVYSTTIDKIQIGSLMFSDLRGTIVPSMESGIVLLGMNALGKLHITQSGDTLTLRPD